MLELGAAAAATFWACNRNPASIPLNTLTTIHHQPHHPLRSDPQPQQALLRPCRGPLDSHSHFQSRAFRPLLLPTTQPDCYPAVSRLAALKGDYEFPRSRDTGGSLIRLLGQHNRLHNSKSPAMASRGPPGARGMGNRFAQFKLVLLGTSSPECGNKEISSLTLSQENRLLAR